MQAIALFAVCGLINFIQIYSDYRSFGFGPYDSCRVALRKGWSGA